MQTAKNYLFLVLILVFGFSLNAQIGVNPTKSAYVDPEVKRLIQGLKADYQYQIDALKLRIEALENENPQCDCIEFTVYIKSFKVCLEGLNQVEIKINKNSLLINDHILIITLEKP